MEAYENVRIRHLASKSTNLSACFIVLVFIMDKITWKECVERIREKCVHVNIFHCVGLCEFRTILRAD